jgi:hypothetical protein
MALLRLINRGDPSAPLRATGELPCAFGADVGCMQSASRRRVKASVNMKTSARSARKKAVSTRPWASDATMLPINPSISARKAGAGKRG